MARSDLTIDGVSVGRLDGRGKLVGTVDVRDGKVLVRVDDEDDQAVWVELSLSLTVLVQAEVARLNAEDGEIDLMAEEA